MFSEVLLLTFACTACIAAFAQSSGCFVTVIPSHVIPYMLTPTQLKVFCYSCLMSLLEERHVHLSLRALCVLAPVETHPSTWHIFRWALLLVMTGKIITFLRTKTALSYGIIMPMFKRRWNFHKAFLKLK